MTPSHDPIPLKEDLASDPRANARARRQREYRGRKKAGTKIVPVELTPRVVDRLITERFISYGEFTKPEKLSQAVADMQDCWVSGTLRGLVPPSLDEWIEIGIEAHGFNALADALARRKAQ